MPRIELAELTPWITTALHEHGAADFAGHLAARLNIGRRSAYQVIARLQAAQWLNREGSERRPRFRPGLLRQVVQRYPLAGLDEDRAWRKDFAPFFVLPGEVARMARHAFTEIVNNAIDHSGGTAVTVSLRQTPLHLQMLVSDDGCGLFQRLAQHFDLGDPASAMLELSKGRLTSDPDRHCGHGLFFTAQLADVFDVRANAAGFQSRAWSDKRWHEAGTSAALADRPGTAVFLGISLDTPRTLDEVLRGHSLDGRGYAIERVRVPLHLVTEAGALVSRAEARRVGARLKDFKRIELDFSGVEEVGHGFADELLRVMGRRLGGLEMHPVGASPRVAAMLSSVTATG